MPDRPDPADGADVEVEQFTGSATLVKPGRRQRYEVPQPCLATAPEDPHPLRQAHGDPLGDFGAGPALAPSGLDLGDQGLGHVARQPVWSAGALGQARGPPCFAATPARAVPFPFDFGAWSGRPGECPSESPPLG